MNKDDRIALCMDDDRFGQWIKSLHVPKAQTSCQTLIEEYIAQSEARCKRKKYAFIEHLPQSIKWEMERKYKIDKLISERNVLAIDVSDKLVRRACVLMDYIIVKLKELGADISVETYRVNQDNTKISWQSIVLYCSLAELKTKYRNLSSENKSRMIPPYELIPTGKLSLCFIAEDNFEVFSFEDHEDTKLENRIAEILLAFRTYVIKQQKAIDEKREQEHQQWIERRKAAELEEQQQKERQRILEQEKQKQQRIAKQKQQIEGFITDWERTKRIHVYIEDLCANIDSVSEEERKSILNYCEMVKDLFRTEDRYRDIIRFVETCNATE